MTKLANYTRDHPLQVVLILFLLNYIVRYIDIIALDNYYKQQDLIFSKLASLLIILFFLKYALYSFKDIGFNREYLPKNIWIGFYYACIIAFIVPAILYCNWQVYNYKPKIVIEPFKLYTLYLAFFFILNAIMEESLFRGLFIRIIHIKYSIQFALVFQATLFAIWHIIVWYLFQTKWNEELVIKIWGDYFPIWTKCFGYLLPTIDTFFIGMLLGIIYLKTSSLWSVISWHIFYNIIKFNAYITVTNKNTSFTDIAISNQYYSNIPSIILQAGLIIYLWKRYEKTKDNASKYKMTRDLVGG
jgi:membrane protease YdiL (CAAX protease family)